MKNYTEELRSWLMNTPEFMRCIGYDQNNPHHSMTLDKHMQAVEYYVEDVTDSEQLACAALLHDIGKPVVAFTDKKTGFTRFFGHAGASADIARELLLEGGCTDPFTYEVTWYIRHHDDFISFKVGSVPENHPFLRSVNVSTVAEALLKTAITVEADAEIDVNATVRFLFSLRVPSWGKMKPWNLQPDGLPPMSAFMNLMVLCRADTLAQADTVYNPDGSVQTTKAEKLAVVDAIEKILPEAYALAENVYVTRLLKIAKEAVENMTQTGKRKRTAGE